MERVREVDKWTVIQREEGWRSEQRKGNMCICVWWVGGCVGVYSTVTYNFVTDRWSEGVRFHGKIHAASLCTEAECRLNLWPTFWWGKVIVSKHNRQNTLTNTRSSEVSKMSWCAPLSYHYKVGQTVLMAFLKMGDGSVCQLLQPNPGAKNID